MINEMCEFLAYFTFMIVVMGLTFFFMMFFVESIIGLILLYLFRKIIKRL